MREYLNNPMIISIAIILIVILGIGLIVGVISLFKEKSLKRLKDENVIRRFDSTKTITNQLFEVTKSWVQKNGYAILKYINANPESTNTNAVFPLVYVLKKSICIIHIFDGSGELITKNNCFYIKNGNVEYKVPNVSADGNLSKNFGTKLNSNINILELLYISNPALTSELEYNSKKVVRSPKETFNEMEKFENSLNKEFTEDEAILIVNNITRYKIKGNAYTEESSSELYEKYIKNNNIDRNLL